MYNFFMISGFIFTVLSSILLTQTYNIFQINKVTKFIYPTEDTIFNNINISLIPIVLWSYIEIIILGTNSFFITGIILNIFLNCSISYIMIYGYTLISQNKNDIVKILSILTGNIFGYIINYICLLIGKEINMFPNFIAIIILTLLIVLIKIYPPKSYFFRGK